MEKKANILDLAQGAVKERIDIVVGQIVDNILDLNTPPDKKRTLTITINFTPSAHDRTDISTTVDVKSKLQAAVGIRTSLCVGKGEGGELVAVEKTTQMPGQYNMYGEEEPQPKIIKIG